VVVGLLRTLDTEPPVNHRHIIKALALLVILSGCTYAYERESLRSSLPDRFHHINTAYFNGQLVGVQVRWGLLDDDYGAAYSDGTIVVDSASVKDSARLDEVLRHEMCHEFVGVEHQHNEVWRTCMERFENR
jgi:SprT-like family